MPVVEQAPLGAPWAQITLWKVYAKKREDTRAFTILEEKSLKVIRKSTDNAKMGLYEY